MLLNSYPILSLKEYIGYIYSYIGQPYSMCLGTHVELFVCVLLFLCNIYM